MVLVCSLFLALLQPKQTGLLPHLPAQGGPPPAPAGNISHDSKLGDRIHFV